MSRHDFAAYEEDLIQKGSYVVVRGEVKQLFLMDNNATILNPPRDRVLYYANFPKLQGKTLDSEYFSQGPNFDKNSRQLTPSKMGELKEKFKDVLRLQIEMANANQEGLDVVTPNAFFQVLDDKNQKRAKELFAEAVMEVSSEKPYPNFQGLFVHDTEGMQTTLLAHQAKLQIPVVVHNGDASSPQLAAKDNNLHINVAEAIMGEQTHGAGNAALGDRANKAKEENDTRMMGGYVQLIFTPAFNKTLYDTNRYQSNKADPAPRPLLSAAASAAAVVASSSSSSSSNQTTQFPAGSAHQRTFDAIKKKYPGIQGISVQPKPEDKTKLYLTITFKDWQEAQQFSKAHSNLKYNNNQVFLGGRAQSVLKDLGVETHHSYKMWDSLQWEYRKFYQPQPFRRQSP